MNATEVQAICTTCGAGLVNVVIIDGKPYGTECASQKLGLKQMPHWFSEHKGEYRKQEDAYNLSQAERIKEYNARVEKMRNDWVFIHKFSVAFWRARQSDNAFEIKFLADMSCKLGIQGAKDSAHNYETFEAYHEKEYKQHYGAHIMPLSAIKLSEKQQALLDRILG